jgi:hypothetical protein
MSKFEIKPLKFSKLERASEEYTYCYAGTFYGTWEVRNYTGGVFLIFEKNNNLATPLCVRFGVTYDCVGNAIAYANRLNRIMMRQYLVEVE